MTKMKKVSARLKPLPFKLKPKGFLQQLKPGNEFFSSFKPETSSSATFKADWE